MRRDKRIGRILEPKSDQMLRWAGLAVCALSLVLVVAIVYAVVNLI